MCKLEFTIYSVCLVQKLDSPLNSIHSTTTTKYNLFFLLKKKKDNLFFLNNTILILNYIDMLSCNGKLFEKWPPPPSM